MLDFLKAGSASPPCVRIVPFWIRLAISRAKLPAEVLFDYEALRPQLALEDLAEYDAVQNLRNTLLESFGEFTRSLESIASAVVRTNYRRDFETIAALAKQDSIGSGPATALVPRLSDSKLATWPLDSPTGCSFFQAVPMPHHRLLIYIEPGILPALESPDIYRVCVTDYLKALFTLGSAPAVVGRSRVFRRYLELL